MNTCRRMTLSSTVVVSTAEGPGKVNALMTLEDATLEDGDKGL